MHVVAAKAVCFKQAMEPAFAQYQKRILANATRLSRRSSPWVPPGRGGTDNHLMLVDNLLEGRHGKAAEVALGKAGITVTRTPSRSTRTRRWWQAASA